MEITITPEHLVLALMPIAGIIVATPTEVVVGSRLTEAGAALTAGGVLLATEADIRHTVLLYEGDTARAAEHLTEVARLLY